MTNTPNYPEIARKIGLPSIEGLPNLYTGWALQETWLFYTKAGVVDIKLRVNTDPGRLLLAGLVMPWLTKQGLVVDKCGDSKTLRSRGWCVWHRVTEKMVTEGHPEWQDAVLAAVEL